MTVSALRKIILLTSLLVVQISAQCATNQNPSCAGNAQFEQLCCNSPSVCYWSNRNGDPACCAAGADCRGDGGPVLVIGNTPAVVTQVQSLTTYYSTSVYTKTSQYTGPSWVTVTTTAPLTTYSQPQITTFETAAPPVVVVVTASSPVVATLAASPTGAYITVTQVQVVAGARKSLEGMQALFRAAVFAGLIATLLLAWT